MACSCRFAARLGVNGNRGLAMRLCSGDYLCPARSRASLCESPR